MASGGAPDEQAILQHFQQLRNEVDTIWSKITELDLERQEHLLVGETLAPLEPGRRCFRLVGGVLVERTVAEVAPAVTRNREALEQARAALRRGRGGCVRAAQAWAQCRPRCALAHSASSPP